MQDDYQVIGGRTVEGEEYGAFGEIAFLCGGRRYLFANLDTGCKGKSGHC